MILRQQSMILCFMLTGWFVWYVYRVHLCFLKLVVALHFPNRLLLVTIPVLDQVVEHGLGHLPFTEKQVITPTGELSICLITMLTLFLLPLTYILVVERGYVFPLFLVTFIWIQNHDACTMFMNLCQKGIKPPFHSTFMPRELLLHI